MRLLIYTRVSTDEQARGGSSLGAQEHQCRAWAAILGHEIVGVISDAGVSGGVPPIDRPGFNKAARELHLGHADGVVACALDRISRVVLDTLSLLTYFDAQKWALVSIRESLDTSTPMGRFTLTIMSAMAELERGLIASRTKEGLDQLRREGKKYTRITPFGKTLTEDGRYVENPVELTAIRRILEMRAQRLTAIQIAEVLNQEVGPHPRHNLPWKKDYVENVMTSQLRLGIGRQRKYHTRGRKTKREESAAAKAIALPTLPAIASA